MPISQIYTKNFVIPKEAIDENGHVNNVAYVQWMQDIAIEHYSSLDGIDPMQEAGAMWVVREHRIEYLLPAFAGEEIEIKTWMEDIRRVRSLRKYEFVRKSDGKVLVKGETDWVFVDIKSGRPLAIPNEVVQVFSKDPKGLKDL
ncbi:MAG TPA: thioesterase family protein [Anaerolineales bacterium]|nr:thioesterase family protein [Anaerolineales bacterium]